MSDLALLETVSDAAPVHAPTAEPTYHRFTQSELGLILSLTVEGKTQTEIAQRFGCTQSAISYALKRLGADTSGLAIHHAKVKSYNAVRRLDRVAQKGKDDHAVKAASKLLEVAGIVGTSDSKGHSAPQVLIQIGVQAAPEVTQQGAKVSIVAGALSPERK